MPCRVGRVTRPWLDGYGQRVAALTGADAPALTAGEVEALLELARIAAHDSGDRTNAPLAAFVAGMTLARHPERALSELVSAAAGPAEPS